MIPLRLLDPASSALAATALLALSALGPRRAYARRRRGVLDADTMPDWQKRDLGMLDGRPSIPPERFGRP